MICGIYKITNIITNKIYIGQSVNIKRRWAEHKARAFNPLNNCWDKPLYRSMRKYGIDVFTIEVLCECDETELTKKEAEFIAEYNSVVPNGYNILPQSDRETKMPHCSICGKVIDKGSKSGLCRECYVKSTRIVERPDKETLYQLLKENSFCAVGKMYGVSDNAIRKWCKNYGLPIHARNYK